MMNYTSKMVVIAESVWKVVNFLQKEAERSPSQINVTSLGQTYEGRDIYLAKVSKSGSPSDKPVIYVNCAIHAREWITTAVCVWMIRQVTNRPWKRRLKNHGGSF